MKPIKATGRTNARRGVVNHGRTRVMSRFLTINVQICLRKRFIVACLEPEFCPGMTRDRSHCQERQATR